MQNASQPQNSTSPQTPTIPSSNNSQPTIQEINIYEKLHYDKHIEFLKWIVGIAGTAIAVMVAVGLWFTYSNVKEYKDELKENADAAKLELQDKEKELVNKEENMKKSVDSLLFYTKDEVQNTKQQALNQIGNIKSLATEEARNRVNQVFESKNLDKFIEQVAEDRMEPKVQSMVDTKMKQISALNDKKIEDAINNLSSTNLSIANPAMNYLQLNQEYSFSEYQVNEIILQFTQLQDGSSIASPLLELIYNLNNKNKLSNKQLNEIIDRFKNLPVGSSTLQAILTFLDRFEGDLIDTFFKNLAFDKIKSNYQDDIVRNFALNHFCNIKHLQEFTFYHDYLGQFKNTMLIDEEYMVTVGKLSFADTKLTIQLLNDKELIDSVFRHMDMFYDIIVEQRRSSMRGALNPNIPKEEIENTFFFTHMPVDIRIYPKDPDPSSSPHRVN